jgi:ribose-phosphate pyrophosphokinase
MAYGAGISLMATSSGKYFAELILPHLNENLEKNGIEQIQLTKTIETIFENTEIKSNILESIRGHDVYIVCDVSNRSGGLSINDNVVALKTLVASSKVSDASRINLILPTFPYARQDKAWGREGITAKMFARELELCGANTIITLDIHNPAIVGFFDKCVVENLKGFRDLFKYILKNIDSPNLVVTSPDVGGIKRATLFATELKRNLVIIYKERSYEKVDCIDKMELIGDVKGKDVLLVDDMIDTGGAVYKSDKLLKERGANKIYNACSLPFFNGKAIQRMDELYNNKSLESVIGTNSVYHEPDFAEKHPWFVPVSVEDYFARVIVNMHTSRSISKLLDDVRKKECVSK